MLNRHFHWLSYQLLKMDVNRICPILEESQKKTLLKKKAFSIFRTAAWRNNFHKRMTQRNRSRLKNLRMKNQSKGKSWESGSQFSRKKDLKDSQWAPICLKKRIKFKFRILVARGLSILLKLMVETKPNKIGLCFFKIKLDKKLTKSICSQSRKKK